MRELIFIAAILVCPLMMVLMMRHGHGHGHADAEQHRETSASTDELRRRRAELDQLITEREVSADRRRVGLRRGASAARPGG